MSKLDEVTVGDVTAIRIEACWIDGTSSSGPWAAYLPLNGRTSYRYPDDADDAEKARIRRAVAKLVA